MKFSDSHTGERSGRGKTVNQKWLILLDGNSAIILNVLYIITYLIPLKERERVLPEKRADL